MQNSGYSGNSGRISPDPRFTIDLSTCLFSLHSLVTPSQTFQAPGHLERGTYPLFFSTALRIPFPLPGMLIPTAFTPESCDSALALLHSVWLLLKSYFLIETIEEIAFDIEKHQESRNRYGNTKRCSARWEQQGCFMLLSILKTTLAPCTDSLCSEADIHA